ncbi:DUF2892 domain-containing protein [uncultured Cytophaga sp.]|uniref:YgaP family membrane protein n=1 Tax=uncultured Cytophaga sp. TaxID=160238 RepID=UPI003455346B
MKNIGNTDRIIRIAIAIVISILFATDIISGTLGIILLLVAIVLVVTSMISTCPLYLPFGISTCKKEKH